MTKLRMASLLEKLQVNDRSQAVLEALRRGLIRTSRRGEIGELFWRDSS